MTAGDGPRQVEAAIKAAKDGQPTRHFYAAPGPRAFPDAPCMRCGKGINDPIHLPRNWRAI